MSGLPVRRLGAAAVFARELRSGLGEAVIPTTSAEASAWATVALVRGVFAFTPCAGERGIHLVFVQLCRVNPIQSC